jgi:hypothetical protein
MEGSKLNDPWNVPFSAAFDESNAWRSMGKHFFLVANGKFQTLVEILLFVTSHYATSMQLVDYNYHGHVCNYKFCIGQFLGHMVMCEIKVQLNVYNMHTCHKNNGLNIYVFKTIYLIYLHRLCIIILCTFSTKVKPMLTKASLN